MFPTKIDSWRFKSSELALNHRKWDVDSSIKPMNLIDFIIMLENCIGKTFIGYMGEKYIMSKDSSVWVANFGEYGNTAIIDIVLNNEYIVNIITGYRKF